MYVSLSAVAPRRRPELSQHEMAYFVKWKNYPETENSWVREQDAPYVPLVFAISLVLTTLICAGTQTS